MTLRTIELTKGYVTLVDDEDYEWLSEHKWYVSNYSKNNTQYAKRNTKKCESEKQRTMRMHRLIMNCSLDMMVDHIDGNGLNNQRSNLRLATRSENGRNQGISRANTSGYKGVSFNIRDSMWCAYIVINGIKKHICSTNNVIESAVAYNKAALEMFGEFAKLNVIPIQDGTIQENKQFNMNAEFDCQSAGKTTEVYAEND